MEHKKHIHHGKSSRSILNAERVLNVIGVKEGEVFLDAGCGDGFISLSAVRFVGDSGRVYAVDIYQKSIEELQKEIERNKLQNIEALIADVTEKIPVADNSTDICLLANVLHGFVENNETEKALKEIVRVLKSDGRLAVVEFENPSEMRVNSLYDLWRKLKLYFVGPPVDVRLSPEKTERILSRYGFKTLKVAPAGEYHYAWVGVLGKKG